MTPKINLIVSDDTLPSRLKWAREWRGFSQAELAKKAGLPASSISFFESGERDPSFNSFRAICYALDVSPDYFIGMSDNVHRNVPSKIITTMAKLQEHYDVVVSCISFFAQKEGIDDTKN